jgi:hypothetical protein
MFETNSNREWSSGRLVYMQGNILDMQRKYGLGDRNVKLYGKIILRNWEIFTVIWARMVAFRTEDRCNIFLRNVGAQPKHSTAQQSKTQPLYKTYFRKQYVWMWPGLSLLITHSIRGLFGCADKAQVSKRGTKFLDSWVSAAGRILSTKQTVRFN